MYSEERAAAVFNEKGEKMIPLVSVIVTHHLDENERYLRLCLESLLASEGVDIEILCISDAEAAPVVPDGVKLFHSRELYNSTKKVHFAIKEVDARSYYLLLVSDDVFVGKHMIAGLVKTCGAQEMIMNPMSNNDLGRIYSTDLRFTNSEGDVFRPGPSCTLEEAEPFLEEIADFPEKEPFIIVAPFVPFYCTLIPKPVWNKVGGLDEALEYRHNDEDYCYRAERFKIPSVVNTSVFALHFGGKTLPKVTTAKELSTCTEIFAARWTPIRKTSVGVIRD